MELFVSLFPVALCVCFGFWLLALFFKLWHDDWLPLYFVLFLGTMWTCQLLSDPLSPGAFSLLLSGVCGCAIAACFCTHRLVRAIVERVTP